MKRWGFKQELGRKVIHLFSIFFLIIYLLFSTAFNEKIALIILAALLVLMIHLEFWRIERHLSIPFINILWKYKRPQEKGRMGSEVYFLIGSIICLAIFDIRVAAAAILMTTFGDMVSSIVGTRFDKTLVTKKKKSLGAIISEFIVNIIVGFVVIRTAVWKLHGVESWGSPIWIIILIMATTATIVEATVTKMDDNLLIPVLAGFNGQLALMFMNYIGWL